MKSVVSISFLVVIFALSLNNAFRIVYKTDNAENRKLTEKPILDPTNLDVFPEEYDAYLNDNFAGRNYFVDFYGWMSTQVFHKKTVNAKYLLGSDNFVFEMKKNLPMYTGKRTITDEQLQRIATEFQKRQTYFTKQGIKMYIELIPSKFKVYSDKLPTLLQKGDHNMGDRFIEYFQENTTIPVIDGAPVLISKKETEPMFYKYDTHFNSLAAFYVHQKLVERIHQDFPNLPLMDTSNFVIEKVEETGGNMKKAAIDQNDVDVAFDILPRNQTFSKVDGYGHKLDGFRYGNYEYCKRYKSAHNDRPKALVIRDSFANLSLSFFPEIFSEVVFIWDDWHYKFNREIVDIEKPDIIIYSFYEGYIDRLLMEPSFVEADQSNDDVQ